MRLLYRAKGALGIRLVTDAMAAAGMPDGEYRLGGLAVSVTGGGRYSPAASRSPEAR